ncbi:hypothetical protein LVDJXP189_790009 [Flavobacterium psychrophilum]|nr:hypothetical protein LVDJXP189_790009 [Flavobacterium psychrophilum]
MVSCITSLVIALFVVSVFDGSATLELLQDTSVVTKTTNKNNKVNKLLILMFFIFLCFF